MDRLTRWRFVTEAGNSPLVWALGIGWAALSVLSTLSLLFPKIGKFVPQWPWYIWVIGGLFIGIVALFEGAYRQGDLLWQLTDPIHLDELALARASALMSRQIHYQHFNVELKEVVLGVCWSSWTRFLFVRTVISCRETVGVKSIRLSVSTDIGKYDCAPTGDISDWLLRTEVTTDSYPFKNIEQAALESLWDKLKTMPLKSGAPVSGWLCFEVAEKDDYRLECLKSVRLQIEDTMGRTQREYRYGVPLDNQARIVHIDSTRVS